MGVIETRADTLLKVATSFKASDVHVVPRQNDALIQFRIQHKLLPVETLSKNVCEKLISHFKFLAGMDIGEKRRPQNGSIQLTVGQNPVSLRLSTLPTIFQESLVIRILPQNEKTSLSTLSLFPQAIQKLFSLTLNSTGLIILTGPTGSGKTTTLYSLLHAAQQTLDCNIITLEDPIEKQIDTGCIQVQVNEKAGITYAVGLKAILRHDPDIIMVGEIRDEETAKAAIRAGLTGHLVLSTMHTKDARGAIYRLMDLGIPIKDIEQTLVCATAQRLVNLKCPYCKDGCSPYCLQLRKVNRLSIYEMLYGSNLHGVIKEAKGEKAIYNYRTLLDLKKKGIALGYLSDECIGEHYVEE
ncbi:competence type IV pilus ATPase ComGA [Bacillus sp. Marseille-P3661]|uniref:competence type IV pilus ATPase ComGA n=1 Tax=Bacillus sp. Marseille-P3661 TaxID=1936234 RepID=UPI000C81921B|nr:competence type IV pilus ATPase ComGA [Bacillus sp. Marseille-P3661]